MTRRPELPVDLQEHIRAGGAVRRDASQAFAGRCGKTVARRNGDTVCRRAAGWGTEHLGVGTCRDHTLGSPGLDPWVGDVAPDEWQRITGHQTPGPNGTFAPTHGTSGVLRSIEDLLAETLDDTDRQLFFAVPTDDPRRLLDAVTRVFVVSLNRVQDHVTRTRRIFAAEGTLPPAEATAGAESLLAKLGTVLARLQETRAKFDELDRKDDQLDNLAVLLAGLNQDQFLAIVADPSRLGDLRPGHL